MQNVKTTLDGKKTYLVALVVALYNLAVALGWISPAHQQLVNEVLGAGGLAALRLAVSKNK